MINDGKLAVVMGMEVSEPFGCRLMQPGNVADCAPSSRSTTGSTSSTTSGSASSS